MAEEAIVGIPLEDRMPLWEQVYRGLRRAIQRGDFPPGTRLVEERLAESFGVSRTPVREALYRLEKEGLVIKIPHRGIIVREHDPEELREVLELRGLLEGYAAYLATKRKDEGLFDELEGVLRASEDALKRGDVDELIELNTQFHETLYRRCGNRRLFELIKELRDQFHRFRVWVLKLEGMPQQSIQDHRRMIELMRKGEAEAVEALVRVHIGKGKEKLLEDLQRKKRGERP